MSSPIFGDLSPRGNPQLGGRTGRSVEVGSMTVGDLHDRSSEGSPPAERVEDSSTCDTARLLAIPPAPPARTGLVASIGRLLHSPWWRRAGARLIGLVVDNRIARDIKRVAAAMAAAYPRVWTLGQRTGNAIVAGCAPGHAVDLERIAGWRHGAIGPWPDSSRGVAGRTNPLVRPARPVSLRPRRCFGPRRRRRRVGS